MKIWTGAMLQRKVCPTGAVAAGTTVLRSPQFVGIEKHLEW